MLFVRFIVAEMTKQGKQIPGEIEVIS